jgi:hypothetical protein
VGINDPKGGAWDYLRVRDLVPEKDGENIVAAKLIVYHGQPEQYCTYITPEAYTLLQEYLGHRKSSGEDINDKSPLMRNLFVPDKGAKKGAKGDPLMPIPLKSTGVKRLIENAWMATGAREKLEDGRRRHEFEALHCFRKYHETACVRAGMKIINVKLLRGDSIGLEDSYNRPDEEELLEDYKHAIPELTITEAERLKSKGVLSESDMELKMYRTLVETLSLDLTSYNVRALLSERLKLEKLSDEDCADKEKVERWTESLREKLGSKPGEDLFPDIWLTLNPLRLTKNSGTAVIARKGAQKIIEEAELQRYLDEGFEYVSTLPSGKIVVRKGS